MYKKPYFETVLYFIHKLCGQNPSFVDKYTFKIDFSLIFLWITTINGRYIMEQQLLEVWQATLDEIEKS